MKNGGLACIKFRMTGPCPAVPMAGGPLVGPERPGGGVDVGAGERLEVRRTAVGVQKHVRVRL